MYRTFNTKGTFTIPKFFATPVIYRVVMLLVRCWCKCFYQCEVSGREYLPKEGPAIILPKHQYWTDIPLIALAFRNIYLYYVAKEELFRFPPASALLSALGGIPLDRKAPIKSLNSFRHLSVLLKKQKMIVIFPEGTYYRGTMGRGRSGLLRLILKLQEREFPLSPIPFVPVGIIYQKRKFKQKVTIAIGQPLYGKGETEAETFTHEIMKAIAFLSRFTVNGDTA